MWKFFHKFHLRFLIFSYFTLALMASVEAFALVKISKFTNMAFGTWSGSGNMVATNDLCVYNTLDVNYKVTASGTGGSFIMSSGGQNLAYEVRFKKNGGSYVQLTHGTPSSTFNNADIVSDSCSNNTNSTLQVTVTAAALSAAVSGNYTGTLTILLEPG